MPKKRLPVYRLVIDENTEGMDFMGLVDYPAHGKKYVTFNKLPKVVEHRYAFNDEKQIVKGVAIATDLQIYRRDPNGYEYRIYFTKEDTLKIMKMFAKKGYHNNVNLMHDQSKKVTDAYLIESFFINDDKSNIPAEFADQNLQPGSLIFSYWVESPDTWKFVKEKGAGFSIEGWFKEIEVKFIKQKKMKKSLLQRLGLGSQEPEKKVFDKAKKDKYATATTADGVTVYWETELKEGETLWIVPAEGEDPVLANGDEYALEIDGVMKVVKVDDAGIITSVEDAEEMDEENQEVEEAMKAMKAAFEKQLADQKSAFDKVLEDKLTILAKEITELREAIERDEDGDGKKGQQFKGKNGPGWKRKN